MTSDNGDSCYQNLVLFNLDKLFWRQQRCILYSRVNQWRAGGGKKLSESQRSTPLQKLGTVRSEGGRAAKKGKPLVALNRPTNRQQGSFGYGKLKIAADFPRRGF
ncbi:hypothetical protein RRG08_044469 [Elysia crispata]|uniref:Uncharacterized protein n=1 Tax=Elysia crispata TaxID=231223 RepID=A0AAE0Z0L3_9GAST|nr:hypothetical protein RRG08_044469 [Elysia crispata]